MKKNIPLWIMSIAASLFLSTGLLAQEKAEVSVKIKKDGKVVKDTSYLFDDIDEARHALEMMDLVSGDDIHKEHIHYNYTSAHTGSGETKTMVFISEDGETTEISEFSGDSNVWVSKEIEEGDVVKTKEVKVVVSGDEEGNWTVVESDEVLDKEENVYIIEGDDNVKVEMRKILEEHNGEEDANVKVIVIKKSGDKDCDHDEDHDHDKDHDHDEDIEVKVIKKK